MKTFATLALLASLPLAASSALAQQTVPVAPAPGQPADAPVVVVSPPVVVVPVEPAPSDGNRTMSGAAPGGAKAGVGSQGPAR